jgi:hypothetical protein
VAGGHSPTPGRSADETKGKSSARHGAGDRIYARGLDSPGCGANDWQGVISRSDHRAVRVGDRTVVSSIIVANGVFTGVGRIVEVANRPGDPDNVNRDDLVFGQGRMHIRNTNQAPEFSVDPQTCAFTARLKQTSKIQGGTSKFRHASGTFASGVRAWGALARNPDGSCNEQADPLLEADVVFARGTLSF